MPDTKTHRNSLLTTGVVYIISTIMIKGIVFFTMPIFTNILSVSDYGLYNTYMSYEGILNIVFAVGAVLAIRNARLDHPDDFSTFKHSLVDLELVILIISLLITSVFKEKISELLGLERHLLFCLIFHSFGSALITLFTQIFQIDYRVRAVVLLSLFTTAANIILSFVFIQILFGDEKYIGRIFGSAAPAVTFAFFICLYYFSKKEKLIESKYWKYILLIGLPALPQILSENLILQADRIMISRMVGEYEAGIYGVISTVGTILMLVFNALDSALVPWLYRKIQINDKRTLISFVEGCVIFAGILSIGFAMVSPEIIRVFTAKQDYWNHTILIIPFTMMNFLRFIVVLLSNFEFYHKKGFYPSAGIGVCCVINIAMNYCMIPIAGYSVAALTSLVAMLLNSVYHIIVTKRLNYHYYKTGHITLTIIATLLILFLDAILINDIALRYIVNSLIVIIAFIWLLKKKKILEVIKT